MSWWRRISLWWRTRQLRRELCTNGDSCSHCDRIKREVSVLELKQRYGESILLQLWRVLAYEDALQKIQQRMAETALFPSLEKEESMPVYTYRCPACGWTGDRIVKLAERDEQRCEASKEENAKSEHKCDGELVREEIALNAKMGHRWLP